MKERKAWHGRIIDGQKAEYKRRHDHIWPEMKALLKEAGISNYTIWAEGNELFGYYECDMGLEYADRVQAQSEIVDRWNGYMKDVLILDMDPETGAQPEMDMMFYLE